MVFTDILRWNWSVQNIERVLLVLDHHDLIEALVKRCPRINEGVKKVEDLIKEIKTGETSLIARDNTVIRFVQIVNIACFCSVRPGCAIVETRQEWNNGEVLERRDDNSKYYLIAEKLIARESSLQSSYRTVEVRLGVKPATVKFNDDLYCIPNHPSDYQGIITYASINSMTAEIAPENYKEEYKEVGLNTTVYFSWRELSQVSRNSVIRNSRVI